MFERQKNFILNYKYIPLIGFGDKKLGDYFLPSQSRKNSSLAGKTIDKKLYEEMEKLLDSNEE